MGAEISIHRSRTVSPCEEGMNARFQNNYHPLHFHQVHGDHIRLFKNRAVARRSEGFCKGLAFSDRPVMVCEPVYVKFVEISSNWTGALRIGFTMHDPMSMKSKLPKYSCPDLTSVYGNWAKAITERLVKKDSILYFYVDQSGDVHYGIDAEEYGVFFGRVNTTGKLWAVLDIYGNTVGVEFIDPSTLKQDSSSETASNYSIATIRTSVSLNSVPQLDVSSLNFDVAFHEVHGENATLKENRSIVSRKPGFQSCAYAFTEEPIKIGQNIVFQVVQTDNFYSGVLMYGITSCDPSTINPSELPDVSDDLLDRPEYWVVRKDFSNYEDNDIIVYNLSAEGEIAVVKNCEHRLAVFHVDPTQPLWLFINVVGSVLEVRFVGASFVNDQDDFTKKLETMKVSLPSNADMEAGPSSQRSKECVICLEEFANCVVYRCGHVCMCYECALKIWKPASYVQCPMCRETIQDIIKIY